MKIKDPVYIGEVIKRRRDDIGFTQDELAFRSKIVRSYLSELERNLKSPSLYTILRLAKGLELNPGELVNEIEQQIQFDEIFKNLPYYS